MRYVLIFAVILLLGCDIPGVGELSERVDDLEDTTTYDDSDLDGRVGEVEYEMMLIDGRVTAIEDGGVADISHTTTELRTPADTSDPEPEVEKILVIADIEGLQDSLDILNTNLSDSITVLDESIEILVLSLDSLTMENDSLRVDLEDLQEKVTNLSYTVENMRYTGTESGSTRGGSSSGTSSGTSGRGSSTTGTTGTTSGGR